MIDLEKLAKWSAILSILWLAMWMSHVYTVKIIREDIAELYLDVHEASEEGGLEIESSGNPQLDTLAWCLAHTNMIPSTSPYKYDTVQVRMRCK